MDFKDHGFKPADVVKGLNEYYEKRKKDRDSTFIVRTGTDRIGETYYMNPEVYVKEAINWLRDECNIFYTPGMKLEDGTKDIFDTPRYKFLSILSADLGFRTIVGPGNADKTEQDILRVVKHLLGIKKKYDGTSCAYDKRIDMLCREYNIAPCEEDDIALKIDYIFGVLDEWRKRALKAEEDRAKYKGMLNTMYGASCGGDVIDVLPCYRDSCNNPKAIKERDAAKDALAELRAKIREVYREVFKYGWEESQSYVLSLDDILKEFKEKDAAFKAVCDEDDIFRKRTHEAEQKLFELRAKIREAHREVFGYYGLEGGCNYVSVLNEILGEFNFQKKLKEKAEEKAVGYKTELNKCRADILRIYREIFDCSNGDPEGSDEENLNDILEEYRNVSSALDDATDDLCRTKTSLSNLRRQYADEEKLVSSVRAERDSNRAKYLVFLDKLARVLDVSYSNPNYTPAKEQDILRAVGTLKTAFDSASEELEKLISKVNDTNKNYDNLDTLYKSSLKLLGEYLTEAKDILGIDTCDKDAITKAIKDLKSAYNNLRNDYDEVCEGHEKLEKDYEELGKAYSSVLKWNNSYADIRRLLEVPADADAGVMVGALNKFMCDYEKLRKDYDELEEAYRKAELNGNYFVEFEKNCSARQAFIFKLCESLDVDKDSIGSFFEDEEAAILKAIDEHHEATASIDSLRQNWYSRYKSEHERANGEHKRAEKCFGEIAALKTQVASLERSLNAAANEQVGVEAFRNECRKLRDEKAKVIKALGQDIWDSCVE